MSRCPSVAMVIRMASGLLLLFSNGMLSALKHSEICEQVSARESPNFLASKIYRFFNKLGFLGCQEMCFKYTDCKSINYNRAKGECELLRKNISTEYPHRAIYKAGFLHLGREDFNKNITPACREKKCPEHTFCVETQRNGTHCKIVSPYFELEPGSKYVHVNTNTSLTCKAVGLNIRYEWLSVDYTPIGQGDKNGTYVHSDTPGELTLNIGGYQIPQTYYFYCIAKNAGGRKLVSAYLFVYDHPEIIVNKTTPSSSGGTTLNFTCTATNENSPDLYWTKVDTFNVGTYLGYGVTLVESKIKFIKYVIDNPSTDDLGTYYCRFKTIIDDLKVGVEVVSEDLKPRGQGFTYG